MNNLNLSNPKMMDIAVPANLKGLTLEQLQLGQIKILKFQLKYLYLKYALQ